MATDNPNNPVRITPQQVAILLRRLENDYPAGYDYKVLREAAAVIRQLESDK